MKRSLIYGVVAGALAVNLFFGARVYLSTAQAADKESPYPSLELFSFALETVRRDYVDGQKLRYQDLVYGALGAGPSCPFSAARARATPPPTTMRSRLAPR